MNPEIELRSPVLSTLTLWTISLALVPCFLSKLSNLLHSPMHAPITNLWGLLEVRFCCSGLMMSLLKILHLKTRRPRRRSLMGLILLEAWDLCTIWTPCNVQPEEWKRRSRTILNSRCARRQRRWLLQGVFLWAPLHVLKHLGVSLWFVDVHP